MSTDTRLYFLSPDEDAAKQVTHDLKQLGIRETDIHAIAHRDRYPLDLPDSETLAGTTDVTHAAKDGALAGGGLGLVAGITAIALTPISLVATGGLAAIAAGVAGGAAFGTWVSTMIGVSVTDRDLSEFEDALEKGNILMLVDIDERQIEEVKAIILRSCPEAVVQSGTVNVDA